MKDKLISLNVLRGVAAMLVVLYHMDVLQVSFITRLFTWGWIGVDIFFVLSGLFIGISVIKSKPWDTLKYLKRRFLRIAPAYYFSMLVLVALASSYFLVTTNGITHIAVHLLFLHSFDARFHGSINGVYWTLGVEFMFYILMALSYKIIQSDKKIYYYIALWFVISWCWRAYCFYIVKADPMMMFIWTTQLPGMLDEFACGVLLAKLWTTKRQFFENNYIGTFLFMSGLLIVSVFVFHVKHIGPQFWTSASTVIFSRTFLAVGIASVIASFIVFERNNIFVKLCHWSGFCYIGTISYSIYLYHLPIFLNIKNSLPSNNLGQFWPELISLIVILGISALSYTLIEKRFYK